MSDLAAYVGAKYTGPLVDGHYHGDGGAYAAAGGVRYEGAFADGRFHGDGKLVFPNGATYTARWERGVEVPGSGVYQWQDALVFGGDPAKATAAAAPAAPAATTAGTSSGSSSEDAATPAAVAARIAADWRYIVPGDRRFWSELPQYPPAASAAAASAAGPTAATAGGMGQVRPGLDVALSNAAPQPALPHLPHIRGASAAYVRPRD
jgi:hypothetical protein